MCVSVSLEFAWRREAKVSGKSYKTWSTLRHSLRTVAHEAILQLKNDPQGNLDAMSSAIQGVGSGAAAAVTNRQEKSINALLSACCSTAGPEPDGLDGPDQPDGDSSSPSTPGAIPSGQAEEIPGKSIKADISGQFVLCRLLLQCFQCFQAFLVSTCSPQGFSRL